MFVPTDKAFDFLTAKFGGKEASLAQFEKDPEGLKSVRGILISVRLFFLLTQSKFSL